MKFLFKKNYFVLYLLIILLFGSNSFAKDSKIQYTRENLSNYFFGVVSSNQDNSKKAFKHLKQVTSLKDKHYKFNVEFVRTLILLEKFNRATNFSKKVWSEDELFFEADLLLGLDSLVNKDYKNAEKHFQRLNVISKYNPFFQDFIGNVLIAWSKASQGKMKESFSTTKKIPKSYNNLIVSQNAFLKCFFDLDDTEKSFQELINNKEYNFSRYNFFLANYLLYKNKNEQAKKLIKNSRKKNNSNLLIKQSEKFILNNEARKIKNTFNCKNPNDSIAEFFYVIANLYSSEKNYKLSNFYLKISFFLNDKFLFNKALLAENFYYQKLNQHSKDAYRSIKSIGTVYSWYASKSIALILLKEKGKKYSINSLEKEFNSISKPNIEHYFELANFYKDSEYFEKSIKYYSLALSKISEDHSLFSKILDRRGTSYERIGDWGNAEKDLLESLRISPDQPHVLNYLAYSWVDKGINLDKALVMLKKATSLRENDGYIIDSLGWAYYAKKNYLEAEFFLQRAVELMPTDPIINDHYADVLWMLNKNIQARHIWSNVLKFDDTEEELKDIINKKLIFGITKNL